MSNASAIPFQIEAPPSSLLRMDPHVICHNILDKVFKPICLEMFETLVEKGFIFNAALKETNFTTKVFPKTSSPIQVLLRGVFDCARESWRGWAR